MIHKTMFCTAAHLVASVAVEALKLVYRFDLLNEVQAIAALVFVLAVGAVAYFIWAESQPERFAKFVLVSGLSGVAIALMP